MSYLCAYFDLLFHLLDQLDGAAAGLQILALGSLTQGVKGSGPQGLQFALGPVPFREACAAELLDKLGNPVRVVTGAGRPVARGGQPNTQPEQGQQEPSLRHY